MHNTNGTRAGRAALWLSGVLLAVPATAQNNSLFGARPVNRPAATTQPARGTASAAAGPAVRAAPAGHTATPPANTVLLSESPIAVEPPKPRQIEPGTLITIIVREDKQASSDANLKSEKTWDVTSELKKFIRLDEENRLIPQTFPRGTPGADFKYDESYEGKGQYGRRDSLTFRVQVKVLDVKPNGNVILEGRKEVASDEDGYTATLVGECRAADITAGNTVLSTQVYGLKVDVKNRGAARDAARRGWLKRALDFLRPL